MYHYFNLFDNVGLFLEILLRILANFISYKIYIILIKSDIFYENGKKKILVLN